MRLRASQEQNRRLLLQRLRHQTRPATRSRLLPLGRRDGQLRCDGQPRHSLPKRHSQPGLKELQKSLRILPERPLALKQRRDDPPELHVQNRPRGRPQRKRGERPPRAGSPAEERNRALHAARTGPLIQRRSAVLAPLELILLRAEEDQHEVYRACRQ